LAVPLLDGAEISTEFCGVITTQFCFACSLEGVTAMPHGLHARLCHAFLVDNLKPTVFTNFYAFGNYQGRWCTISGDCQIRNYV